VASLFIVFPTQISQVSDAALIVFLVFFGAGHDADKIGRDPLVGKSLQQFADPSLWFVETSRLADLL
jgi:hypothetical protein